MPKLNVIFCGAGEFGLPTLQAMVDAGHRIVGVYSQPDRPAGRGKSLTPTPIMRYALDHQLPAQRTSDINVETLPPADVMVVIAFGQKISQVATEHARLGAVNLHASRLPRHRGAAPINWAIICGDRCSGNSIIRLAPRMDAGAVLAMSSVEIGELETAGELHDRLALDGAPLMLSTLKNLSDGAATEMPQDESLATHARKLSRELSALDFNLPAESLCRRVRGMHPWPGCRVRLRTAAGVETARITLVRARPLCGNSAPGFIDHQGRVGTSNGLMEVVEVQPEGRKPMSLQAFRNGHPWEAGMRIEALQ